MDPGRRRARWWSTRAFIFNRPAEAAKPVSARNSSIVMEPFGREQFLRSKVW